MLSAEGKKTLADFPVGSLVEVVGATGTLDVWIGARGEVVAHSGSFAIVKTEGVGHEVGFWPSELVLLDEEPRVEGCVILTKTGRYVDPLNLDPNEVDVEDVAHALSNQCRFSGHVSAFYSVAEHSVRVAGLLESWGEEPGVCLWGLLHDASEAYLVDLPSPLKLASELGPPYLAAESRAQDSVAIAFDLPRGIPEVVKRADMVLLATERRDLMPPNGEWAILDKVDPLPTTIEPLSPVDAKASFLEAYEDLVEWREGYVTDSMGDETGVFDCESFSPRVGGDVPTMVFFDEAYHFEPWQANMISAALPETKATNPKDAVGSDKLPLHLWPPTATALGALGLLDGMLKYGRSNWREAGVKASIYVDALDRHVKAWFEGEDVDAVEDGGSGLPHLAHALACLAILVDAQAAGKLVDDRQYGGDGWRSFVETLTPHVARLKAKHADKSPRHYTIADTTQ